MYFASLRIVFIFKVVEVPKTPVPEQKPPTITAEKKEKKEVTVRKGMTFLQN